MYLNYLSMIEILTISTGAGSAVLSRQIWLWTWSQCYKALVTAIILYSLPTKFKVHCETMLISIFINKFFYVSSCRFILIGLCVCVCVEGWEMYVCKPLDGCLGTSRNHTETPSHFFFLLHVTPTPPPPTHVDFRRSSHQQPMACP